LIPADFKEAFKPSDEGTDETTATLLSNESIDEIVKKDIFEDVKKNPALK